MKPDRPHKATFRAGSVLLITVCLLGLSLAKTQAAWWRVFLPLISGWDAHFFPGPHGLVLSEVCYDPAGEEPQAEWIELYHRGEAEMDLSSIRLGDEESSGESEGMYRFPPGASISPGEVLVVAHRAETFLARYGFRPHFEVADSDPDVPDLLKVVGWAQGSLNLNDGGDEVLLFDGQGSLLDALSWGDSTFAFDPSAAPVAAGHSLERRPANHDSDSAGDWIEQPEPAPGVVDLTRLTATPLSPPPPTGTPTATPTSTLLPCVEGPLLLTEVCYDPSGVEEPDGEWIELYNPGGEAINLACVKVGDEETIHQDEGMLRFPSGAFLRPGEVLVLANRASAFLAAYGFLPDFEANASEAGVPDMLKYRPWSSGSVNLRNDGDDVLILGAADQLLDSLSWGDSDFAFEPAVEPVPEGYSLERRPADADTDSAQDWRAQPQPAPGEISLWADTPTPLPSSTPTPTPTASPSPTPTGTPEPSQTPTPTKAAALSVVINEIHADPHNSLGDANGDEVVSPVEDQFVEIVNVGEDLDLGGWQLWDAITNRHTFPAGTLLLEGCALVVFGGGTPQGNFGNSTVQTASTDTLSLNPSGDILRLRDASGTFVVTFAYEKDAMENQSITRNPDIFGPEPLVLHSQAAGSGGVLFSPGTKLDRTYFPGCPNP